MRTIVDIAERQIEALDALSRAAKQSRAALIREAIDQYLARRRPSRAGEAFGLWGERRYDGLAYQAQVRSEW